MKTQKTHGYAHFFMSKLLIIIKKNVIITMYN